MNKIEILGTGCSKCTELARVSEEAAQQLGIEYEIIKVTQLNDIMNYGVMITPALVINGQVKASGKVPSVDEIKSLLE